jgi:hypothetical protein
MITLGLRRVWADPGNWRLVPGGDVGASRQGTEECREGMPGAGPLAGRLVSQLTMVFSGSRGYERCGGEWAGIAEGSLDMGRRRFVPCGRGRLLRTRFAWQHDAECRS